MLDNIEILEFAKRENGGKQAWIGDNPQFDMDVLAMDGCTNFRLPPKFHGTYDTVWLFEKPLHEYHILSWKIILDEAIRLVKEEGKLIVKTAANADISITDIKKFLGRNVNIDISIDYEYKNDSIFIIVFNIKRHNFEIYKDNSWTFAMLTGGKKDDVVIKFLESIRNNELSKSQIIISGPKKDIYDKYDVEYLDLSKYRDNTYAEIARKKNDIAKMATGANILIAHDRFYLNDNYFKSFEKYGYDFDFLAVKQITEDNFDFPSYCAVYEPLYIFGQPIDCRDFSILLNTAYVNGGCMVFKTNTLNKIGFNSLLFWNQIEDVEITQEFISKSVIPRVNYLSEMIATDDNSEKMALNYRFDIVKDKKIIFHPKRQNGKRKYLFGITDNKKRSFISLRIKFKRKFPFISIRIKFRKAR